MFVSEQLLVWSLAIGLVVAIVLPYLSRYRRQIALDRSRKDEAAQLGIDQPRAQFPYIDPEQCIGCAACVQACPEGDPLGVVGGTAVVINALRCIGHARCEVACPVGAIEVGLGDLKSRKDVPLLDEEYETSVPGIYIAGELGGLALVRNACLQGRQAMEAIRERCRSAKGGEPDLLDVAIVGAGPAGLSASLSAQAADLRYVLLEREKSLGGSLLHYPRRKMVLTQPVELPPWGALSKEEYSKELLLEMFEQMVEQMSLNLSCGDEVTSIEPTEGHFVVHGRKERYRTRTVLLTLGRRGTPRKLGIPGEESPKVMYRLIDAESYRDQRILLVGGGDSAIEAAVGLARQPGNEVTISYRKEKFFRIKKKNEDAIESLLEAGGVRALFNTNAVEIRPDSVVLRGEGDEPIEIENDYVFIFAGGVPPFAFLKSVGIRFGGEVADAAEHAA